MNTQVKVKGNEIYSPILSKWIELTPEEKIKQDFLCRLVNHYGYSLEQIAQDFEAKHQTDKEVHLKADLVIWRSRDDKEKNRKPVILVECKAELISIHEAAYETALKTAEVIGVSCVILTNLKETRAYKLLPTNPVSMREIVNIPQASIIAKNGELDEAVLPTKSFARDEFSRLLFKCHSIIRNNDKLSPEAAFDEISKILFIKIRYERSNKNAQVYTREEYKRARTRFEKSKNVVSGEPYFQHLFEITKSTFNVDGIFEAGERIRIRENSFESIIKELEIYNLSTTTDDIKGIAFELFLGRTFRGELGQFFTPRTVVDFMVSILDPQEGELICDPCCGSGGFLIKVFEFIRAKIEHDILLKKEKAKLTYSSILPNDLNPKQKTSKQVPSNKLLEFLDSELDVHTDGGRMNILSSESIFGTDANPRMSRTAKMNMIMHGDGHGGIHHHDGLLNVNGIFENRFDVIITNPPFGSRIERSWKITESDKYTDLDKIAKYRERYGAEYDKALRQIEDNIETPLIDLYETGKMTSLTEVIFLERSLNLLKPGGRMGIVLPEGVLNNSNLQKIRDYIESKAKLLLIVSLPQDVFIASGATVKPSLLFLKKFTNEESILWKQIEKSARNKFKKLYSKEISSLQNKISNLDDNSEQSERKDLQQKIKALNAQMEVEIKDAIKSQFDYKIAFAEVKHAGISSTGAVIQNELIELAVAFNGYRKESKLWEPRNLAFEYKIVGNKPVKLVHDND